MTADKRKEIHKLAEEILDNAADLESNAVRLTDLLLISGDEAADLGEVLQSATNQARAVARVVIKRFQEKAAE